MKFIKRHISAQKGIKSPFLEKAFFAFLADRCQIINKDMSNFDDINFQHQLYIALTRGRGMQCDGKNDYYDGFDYL